MTNLVYKKSQKNLLLTRGATLVVHTPGIVKELSKDGLIERDVELSAGKELTVDNFNFFIEMVISHVGDMQVCVPYDFIVDNCTLKEFQKNVIISGICLVNTVEKTAAIQDLMYLLATIGAFFIGMAMPFIKF